jgi:hypothetical protein
VKMETFKIFNLLNYLSKLEEISGRDDSLSSKYFINQPQVAYCSSKCKQNYFYIDEEHYHNDNHKNITYLQYKYYQKYCSNNIDYVSRYKYGRVLIRRWNRKIIKNIFISQVDKIKLKYRRLRALNNLKKQLISNENEALFDKLPFEVKHKIFVNCTHQSLINFAKAYPKYLRTILKPIYWRNIKITFTEDIIRSGDLKYLINYLNKNLRQLTIESISENDYYDFDISCEEVLWHIIKQTSNLT